MAASQNDSCTPELTIVFPARNESRRLPQTLTRLAAYQRRTPRRLEVLVVDDHSDDETPYLAHQLTQLLPINVIRCEARGPGAAMRHGLMRAQGERILLCDADGPVPFDEIDTLWQAIDQGADIACGSRLIGDRERPKRPFQRRVLARGFRAIRHAVAPVAILDTQCGFKMLKRSVAAAIVPRATINGFVFHVELLALAHRFGFDLKEVGVPWRDVPGSSIRPITDSIRMTRQLFELRVSLARPSATANHVEHTPKVVPNRRRVL